MGKHLDLWDPQYFGYLEITKLSSRVRGWLLPHILSTLSLFFV